MNNIAKAYLLLFFVCPIDLMCLQSSLLGSTLTIELVNMQGSILTFLVRIVTKSVMLSPLFVLYAHLFQVPSRSV